MKKHIFLSFLLIALLFSCTEQEQDNPVLIRFDYPVFYASFESSEGPATRTYADPLHRIRWNKGDQISIFNGNTTNLEYMFEGETGDSTGTFRFVDGGNKSAVRTRSVSYKYAVYPYDEECALSEDGTLTVTFPAEQSYVENSFGPKDNTMISISEDDTLFFRNAGGYLILKLYGDATQVTSITLKGNKNEPICGKGYVTVSSDGIPSTRMSEEAGSTLTLKCEDPIPLDASSNKFKEFWFVVPPVTFTEGFTIVIEDSEGRRMTKSTAREVTVTRNERFRMTPLDVPALPATQFVKFEDENFKAYCVKNFDTNWDGEIDMEEALQIKTVSPSSYPTKISSFAGIEFFVNLSSLTCSGNQLTNLDISKNTKLSRLICSGNQLTSLDVSTNTNLTYLTCGNNQLTSLDVSKNTKLSSLSCSGNQLTSLDVSKNTNLTSLTCGSNQLTSLDVSNNTNLTSLECDRNQLTSLDVGKNTKMSRLNCSQNQLTCLDISKNTQLVWLDCSRNQLASLDARKNTRLIDLYCSNNQLTSLDFDYHPDCELIDCTNNQLTSLDVSGCVWLGSINCDNNQLTFIDLRSCPFVLLYGENNPWTQILRKVGQRDIGSFYLPVECCEPDEPEAVDLGLPSGVKWGSFNLWASKPEEYGAYYAWGEVSAFGDYDPENENLDTDNQSKYYKNCKNSFRWETYKWGNGGRWPGEGFYITKYCNDSAFGLDGYTDDLLTLESENDAAMYLLGEEWRMPTAEEWIELTLYCTWEAYEINGVPGVRAKSKVEGYEDRWLFFPLPGRCLGKPGSEEVVDELERGSYWSSSLEYPYDASFLNPSSACRFEIDNSGGGCPEDAFRFEGCSIRPVRPKSEWE